VKGTQKALLKKREVGGAGDCDRCVGWLKKTNPSGRGGEYFGKSTLGRLGKTARVHADPMAGTHAPVFYRGGGGKNIQPEWLAQIEGYSLLRGALFEATAGGEKVLKGGKTVKKKTQKKPWNPPAGRIKKAAREKKNKKRDPPSRNNLKIPRCVYSAEKKKGGIIGPTGSQEQGKNFLNPWGRGKHELGIGGQLPSSPSWKRTSLNF